MKPSARSGLLVALALLLGACGAPPAEDPPPRWGEQTPPDAGVLADAAPAEDAGPEDAAPPDDAAPPEPDAAEADAPPDAPTLPVRSQGHVFYEVFVRSFQDSDGDGIGDLRGLINRLDYLNDGVDGAGDDLEVDGLWLMPIFPAISYHGYDPTDYDAVAPELGSAEDLAELLALCEARGVRVILDLVVNHSSSQHPWFLAARTGPEAPMRDFYLWRDADPGWSQPWGGGRTWHREDDRWYYGLFWSGMPDLNYRNPAVAQAMVDIARRWIARGAAGFRVDAARYLVEAPGGAQADQPETHAFFQRLRAEVEDARPDALLVAEAWADRPTAATYWGGGAEFHQAFDFDLAGAIERALRQEDARILNSELEIIARQGAPWSFEATFLGNHDQDRLASRLQRPSAQRAALGLLLTLPGQPYLYYGDELGTEQGPQDGDIARRTPMAWTAGAAGAFTDGAPWAELPRSWRTRNVADQRQRPDSLLQLTRALIRLRRQHLALAEGSLVLLPQADPAIFAALRQHPNGESVRVVVNLSSGEVAAPAVERAEEVLLGPADPAAPLAPGEVRLTRVTP